MQLQFLLHLATVLGIWSFFGFTCASTASFFSTYIKELAKRQTAGEIETLIEDTTNCTECDVSDAIHVYYARAKTVVDSI